MTDKYEIKLGISEVSIWDRYVGILWKQENT